MIQSAMYLEDEKVWVPDPSGNGHDRVPATFLEPGSPREGIEVDGVRQDVAWVLHEDGELRGTAGMAIYADVRRRLDLRDRHREPILESDARFDMPDLMERAGAECEASVLKAALRSKDPVMALGREADPVADALEHAAVRRDVLPVVRQGTASRHVASIKDAVTKPWSLPAGPVFALSSQSTLAWRTSNSSVTIK